MSGDVVATSLAELEAIIERGRQTFIEVGNALMEIRDRRLYRETHATFEAYCWERWGWTRRIGYNYIEAAQVASNVLSTAQSAPSLTQAVALAPLPPEQQREVAQRVDFATATVSDVRLEVQREKWKYIHSSESNEWYTPATYIESARAVMGGIDVDPASNPTANKIIGATTFYTNVTNGLDKDWPGRVWLNPPYGREQAAFIERLMQQFTDGITEQAVVLVNAHATETTWFAPLWNHMLCFTNHRINYYGTSGSGSTHGSVFIYLGPNRDAFLREFDKWGYLVVRVWP